MLRLGLPRGNGVNQTRADPELCFSLSFSQASKAWRKNKMDESKHEIHSQVDAITAGTASVVNLTAGKPDTELSVWQGGGGRARASMSVTGSGGDHPLTHGRVCMRVCLSQDVCVTNASDCAPPPPIVWPAHLSLLLLFLLPQGTLRRQTTQQWAVRSPPSPPTSRRCPAA